MLWLFQRTMFGKLDNPDNQNLSDCNMREILYMTPLLVMAFWIGLYPKPMFDRIGPSVDKLVKQAHGEYYGQPTAELRLPDDETAGENADKKIDADHEVEAAD